MAFTASTGGGRYKITAANNDKAGRGSQLQTCSIVDELRTHGDWKRLWGSLESTTRAHGREAQVWAMSNMGGRRGGRPERCSRSRALGGSGPATSSSAEWSAPDGCSLDDREAWAQANPALGYLFGESSIRSAMAAPPPVFRAEIAMPEESTSSEAALFRTWIDRWNAAPPTAGPRFTERSARIPE